MKRNLTKFHTTVEEHQKALKKRGPLLTHGKRSAARPEDIQAYIDRHGPYMYHSTHPANVNNILQNGLLPKEQTGVYQFGPGSTQPEFASRPDHTYIGSEPVTNQFFGPVLRVDLRKLDPNLIDTDEDYVHWIAPQETERMLPGKDQVEPWDGYSAAEAWNDATFNKVNNPHDAYRWPTLGAWAEDHSHIIDHPDWVNASLNPKGGPGQLFVHPSLAIRGGVPADAISLHPHYEDADFHGADVGYGYHGKDWQDPLEWYKGEAPMAFSKTAGNWQDKYHYQEATGSKHCGNCAAFKEGHCRMFDAPVEDDSVCDEWTDTWPEKKTSAQQVMPIEDVLRLVGPQDESWRTPGTERLRESIRQEGIKEPIEIGQSGDNHWIEDGAHRLGLAQELGMTHVPVTFTRLGAQQVMYHVAPRSARESILAEGLRPASDLYPEEFDPQDIEYGMLGDQGHVWMHDAYPSHITPEMGDDVWEVHTEGIPLEQDNSEWEGPTTNWFKAPMKHTIPPNRLRLLSDERTSAWHDDPDVADFQHGKCDTYAKALIDMYPHLRFGVLDDGMHSFAHDDQYAYDSIGRHPMPYRGVEGNMEPQFDQDAEAWGNYTAYPYGENGSQEDYERAKALIPKQHPWLSDERTAGWVEVSDTQSTSPQIAQWIQNGGFTVDSYRLQEVPQLPEYLVALPNAETKMNPESLSMRQVRDKAYEAQQYGAPFVGGWLDKMTNTLYLDIVDGFRDLQEALQKAKEWGQLAIYDSVNGKEIRVDSDIPKTPGEPPMDYQPSTTAPGMATPPKEAARKREPSYVQRWIEQTHGPDEFHGHESDCLNPKCRHHWNEEEENELLHYGEIKCPECGLLQNMNGTIGPFNEEHSYHGHMPSGGTRGGLSFDDMGALGEQIVKRAALPGFTFKHDFSEHHKAWPVDHIWTDANGQDHGFEIKTNHSQAQPRFKLGDAKERNEKIKYCAENGLRQGLIGVRLNFHNNTADVFHRPQFTDTWVGAPTMTHMGTFDFSDLNPFKSPGEVPENLPEEHEDFPF